MEKEEKKTLSRFGVYKRYVDKTKEQQPTPPKKPQKPHSMDR